MGNRLERSTLAAGFIAAALAGSAAVAQDRTPASPSRDVQIQSGSSGAGSIVTLGPAVVSPFTFDAVKQDGRVALHGYVPDDAARAALAKSGADATGLRLAGGAPQGFARDAAAGLKLLAMLDSGTLRFEGTAWALSGVAPDALAAMNLREAFAAAGLKDSGWVYDVSVLQPEAAPPPPRIADYDFTAEKLPAGTIALSGHLPTAGMQRYLTARIGGRMVDSTALGAGAPEGFAAAVVAGLDALARFDEGTLTLRDGRWTMTARTDDGTVADSVIAALRGAVDASGWAFDIEKPEPLPPFGAPSTWSAEALIPAPVAEGQSIALETTGSTDAVNGVPEAAPAAAQETVAALEPPPVIPAVSAGPPLFDATRSSGGPLALSGVVPAAAARSYFGVIAGEVPTDNVTISTSLPEDFIGNASAGIRALLQLSDGELSFDGNWWHLKGSADTDAARQAALETLPNPSGWRTEVALTPAPDLCRRDLAAFSARNAVNFQSGKARLTDESLKILSEVAADLALCPETAINVEGYTDADGPDDLNLALSVARAEAVVDALVGLGISDTRLYAVGYGESLPIASNETAAGKQANRRIVFSLADANE